MNSRKRLLALALVLLSYIIIPLARAQTVDATLSVDGKPALLLKAPQGAKLTTTNAYLKVVAKNLELYIWAVPNAKTVDEALPRAAEIIKSEFIKFKPATTKDVKLGEIPGKDVTGPGNEADDEDPGNAEVVFFAVGGHVFAACVHGEFDNAAKEHDPMMAVLATAKPAP
jgi:hypothetical protein